KKPMPMAATEFMAGEINGALYVVGGNVGSATLADLNVYDPRTSEWNGLASLPKTDSDESGRFFGALGVVDGKLYVAGGWRHHPPLPTKTLLIYDPAKNTWNRGPDMPVLSGNSLARVIDGKLYVLTTSEGKFGYANYFHVYDPGAARWFPLAEAPRIHRGGAAGVIDGKFYVAGGHDLRATTAALDVYDPATKEWTPKKP